MHSKWILRGLVCLVFAASAAAFVLALQLFQQRAMLKGRTQKLEQAVRQVAATLEKDDANPEVKLTLAEAELQTYEAMDAPLSQMVNAAQFQLTRLNTTRSELADTRAALSATRDTLAETSNSLVAAQATIVERDATIEARTATIREQEVSLKKLEQEKSDLASLVETVQQQVDDLEVENRDLVDANAALQAKVTELDMMVNPEARKAAIPKGQLGVVAYVNADWNFVVLRIEPAMAKTVMPDLDLLIHRSGQLVGKVRVQTVVDNLAVAEIVNDWQQGPFDKGDYVMY